MDHAEHSPNPANDTTAGKLKPDETAHTSAPTSVQSREPEDAYLTGGQRNLQRRVLGLNVENNQAHPPAPQSPGLHSTGSFTGVATGETQPRKPENKVDKPDHT